LLSLDFYARTEVLGQGLSKTFARMQERGERSGCS
jgi:hypothetical protein